MNKYLSRKKISLSWRNARRIKTFFFKEVKSRASSETFNDILKFLSFKLKTEKKKQNLKFLCCRLLMELFITHSRECVGEKITHGY